MVGYIFGGDTQLSYEQLQERRKIAEQLLGRQRSRPKTTMEGINSAAEKIAGALISKNASKEEKRQREEFGNSWGDALSGFDFGSQPAWGGASPASVTTSTRSAPPSGPAQDRYQIGKSGPAPEYRSFAPGKPVDYAADFDRSLAVTESGGDYGIVNSEGYTGKYQFGQGRLDDFNRATGSDVRLSDFRANPQLQEQVQDWHVQDIDGHIRSKGLDKFIGQQVAGVPITLNGLRAMAHLGGKGGMEKFVTTGGRYDPADSNGTNLSDYARTHAGGDHRKAPAPEGFGINPDPGIMATPGAMPAPDPRIAATPQGPIQNTDPGILANPSAMASASPQPAQYPGQPQTMTDAQPQGNLPAALAVPPQAQRQPQAPQARMAQAGPPQAPQSAPQSLQLGNVSPSLSFGQMPQQGQARMSSMTGQFDPQASAEAVGPAVRDALLGTGQFGQGQARVSSQGQGAPDMQQIAQLMELAASPYASEGQKAIAEVILQREMQRMQPAEPIEVNGQLVDPRTGQVLGDYRTPEGQEPIEVGGVLLDPNTYEPIFDSRQQEGEGGFTLSPGQQRFDAQGNPIASGGAEPGHTMLSPQEVQQLGLPEGAYQRGPDGKISGVGGSGVTVNNNMGEDEFEDAFAKGDAAAIGAVSEAGIAAQRNMVRLGRLETLLAESPTGLAGAATQLAGEWGIPTEGLSNVQAAQSLISSLVPDMRPPGSGQMSDADLALFKESLPRIINQPGGNQLILETLRSIAQYDMQGAQIAQRLRAGEIDRAQAFAELQARENPLATALAGAAQPEAPAPQGQPAAPQGQARPNLPPDWPSATPQPMTEWNGPSAEEVRQMDAASINAMLSAYPDTSVIPDDVLEVIIEKGEQ